MSKKFNKKQYEEYLEQMYYIETESNLLNFRKKEIRKLPRSCFGQRVANKSVNYHLQQQYMESLYGSPMPISPQVNDFLNLFENTVQKNKR